MVTTRFVRRVPIVGLRPGRGASFSNPDTPSARKRLRQRETFFGVMAMTAAISLSCWPEAANNTMRARSATRTGRDRLRRGVFRDLEELIMAIGTYIDRHNESPKPFIWTARAADILEKVKRARRSLNKRQSA